jgi:FkbM family methyltransferase
MSQMSCTIKLKGKSGTLTLCARENMPLQFMIWEIIENKTYFPRGIPEPLLQRDSVCIDIGANIGVFTCYWAKVTGSNVYAIEPLNVNYEQLCRNIELNKLAHIGTYCIAISDVVGESQLRIGRATSGSRLCDDKSDRHISSQSIVNVSTTTFEKFLSTVGVEPEKQPTLLKMDCEGAEFRILTKQTIGLFRGCEMITLEYHSYAGNPRSLAALFKHIGMNVEVFPDHCHPGLGIMIAKKPDQARVCCL